MPCSHAISGDGTAAMIPAAIPGITIVCVSASSHTMRPMNASTPTSSQDVEAEVAQPRRDDEDPGQLARIDVDVLVGFVVGLLSFPGGASRPLEILRHVRGLSCGYPRHRIPAWWPVSLARKTWSWEPRWHMASAVVAAIVLTILMPDDLRLGPNWLLPLIEGGLLVALIVGDPGKIDRRTAALRTLSLGLVSVLILGALRATAELTDHLIHGGKETNSAEALLEAGAVVWLSNILAFALLYWELDGGGAAERAHRPPDRMVDLAFPQQMSPELAPGAWRPRFVDYLYLGFTNATAFSPTDAMPLAPWAKIAMAVQSLISLVILGLVIARAVNIFA